LLLLSLLTFTLLRALPGDPVEVFIGASEKDLSAEQKHILRQELGLDKSLPEQYFCWLRQTMHGNLGCSYKDGRPVLTLILERIPATVSLVGVALLIAVTVGSISGVFMAWLSYSKRAGYLEELSLAAAYAFYSTPSFWLGFLLIAWVGQSGVEQIHLLGLHAPGQHGVSFATVLLPALVLASRRAAKLSLILRSAMLNEVNKDYVLAARARGMSALRTLFTHVGKNSLAPTINLVALSIPALIGGSVLVETVFAWPGMGRLAVEATFARNYPILLALTIIYGTLVILANLAADVMQMIIDPRLREQVINGRG
jgi:peptide/nickel transport system permease protein